MEFTNYFQFHRHCQFSLVSTLYPGISFFSPILFSSIFPNFSKNDLLLYQLFWRKLTFSDIELLDNLKILKLGWSKKVQETFYTSKCKKKSRKLCCNCIRIKWNIQFFAKFPILCMTSTPVNACNKVDYC